MAAPVAVVQDKDSKSLVFFVSDLGALAWRKQVAADEKMKGSGATPYSFAYIEAFPNINKTGTKAQVINKGSDICAHTYWYPPIGTTNGVPVFSIRVFYQDASNAVQELCKDGDGDWYIGKVGSGSTKPVVKAGTGMSCHVVKQGADQYQKIFFFDDDNGDTRLGVAWTKLGDPQAENWSVKKSVLS